ncbi:MAG: 50S ribosomal protein L24 [Cyanobacteria bacterium SIG30]|nr:50S ribosomal protein L24 [Cyanobacteria bacterium SIG30]
MIQKKEKQNIHVKKGDRVIVISGKDKGKIGNVKDIITKDGTVLVEGVNIVTKAQKANPMLGVQGGLVKIEKPINSSKVMLVCPQCEKATRIGQIVKDDKKVRVCKKCNKEID